MKKLNTYLMGMMSVAVCLFSVACSSDDEETTPQKNGKVVTVEAVFANDGVTRAVIEGNGVGAARTMSFESTDVLRLVGKAETAAAGKYANFTASTSGGTKIHFFGTLPAGELDNYTAYLISSGSTWAALSTTTPSLGTISSTYESLSAAFKEAVISGEYTDTDKNGVKDKYVLGLQHAFVLNTQKSSQTFYYGTSESGKTARSLNQNQVVAVQAGTYLKKDADGAGGTPAAANTIYKF